jgi:hypothetical protein
MQTVNVEVDRDKARELYREYQRCVHYSKPLDQEIMRAYQALSHGRLIVRALDSIREAGVHTEGPNVGFPKLAICRADATACVVSMQPDGELTMHASDTRPSYRRMSRQGGGGIVQSRNVFHWPRGSFQYTKTHWRGTSLVPTPPLNLRPKRGLQNYHVLYEAEWHNVVPVDPLLLRRIGRADLWVVVAAWDVSEVERAALATRIRA